MTWRTVHATAVGTSHVVAGKACEDDCWAFVEDGPAGVPHLWAFVADGAGSAANGGEGARTAIHAAAAFAGALRSRAVQCLDERLARECVEAVRRSVAERAIEEDLRPRDFACTFLGLVSSEHGTLGFQVGDGGIVIDVGEGLEAPIKPMQGEFANMTHFVTDDDALDLLQCFHRDVRAARVALFSDGLQRLALNMSSNVPFEPFFSKLFLVLKSSRPTQEDQLQAALVQFLESPAVNERTDDDKSLALAIWAPSS